VVEGVLALEALVASPYRIRTVLAAARRADEVRALVGDRAPVAVRSDAEVADVAGFAFHRGVLASADRRAPPDPGTLLRAGGTVVVTQGLNDHENLGALFRNAAAFGVDAVLLDPTTADPLYRRSVRVSLGHVLRVAHARIPPLPGGLGVVRAAGLEVVALTPAPGAAPVRTLVPGGPPVALVVGAEGPGLTPGTLAAADRRVRIPLAPGVDSLNVATAAAVAFHRLFDRG
jgi:tRNA G18 (ribose-2'-O)-methylase SpoU